MRILLVMASPEFLRFYDSTVRLLADRGHDVLLAVNQQKDAKPVRLEQLGTAGRVELLGLVPKRGDMWEPLAKLVRGATDYVRFLHPRFAEAPALRERLARKGLPRPVRGIDAKLGACSERTVRILLRTLALVERGVPVSNAIVRFIREQRPDVVFVTPMVDVASDQVDIVRAARSLGVPVAVGIASWDNLTNKGLIRVEPDAVLVWNEAQKREAVELHGVAAERVTVTGAQLFDRWFQRMPSRSLEAFTSRVGLPRAERFILFTGSSMFISEPQREVAFVRQWVNALRDSPHHSLRRVPILIRPHPYNGWIWADQDLSMFRDVAIWPRGKYNPVDADNRDDFFDSLYYSRAVVGINTSAMIEAAIVGRPVHSVVTDDFARTQEGTLHFHHLLPEHGGFVRIGRGLTDHAELLAAALADEAAGVAETQRFVRAFLRPHGIDRDCTPYVVDALEEVASRRPLPREGALGNAAARILSLALLPAARMLMRRRRNTDPSTLSQIADRWRTAGRHGRKRLDLATKRAARQARRVRKELQVRLRSLDT